MGLFSFMGKKESATGSGTARSTAVSPREKTLKDAYRVGRFTPSNTQCSPNFINNWINNNVDCFEPVLERYFEEHSLGDVTKEEVILEVYRGFSDLILSEPEIEESAFRLRNPEAIKVAYEIFRRLGFKHGVTLPEKMEK
ncbi:MAG: hypothetical protein M1297_08305 [Nitrospirae bacterium]|nr:hypothetical protein [Nitrospirota bacterium]